MSRLRLILCMLAFTSVAVFCSAADRILFLRIAPTQATLFVSNSDGSGEKPLRQPGALDNFPVWSPRGDLIAFIRKIDGNFEVFTIRPDGTDVRQLTNTPGNEAHLA